MPSLSAVPHTKVIPQQRSQFLYLSSTEYETLLKILLEVLRSALMHKPGHEPLVAGALLALIAMAAYLSVLELKIACSAAVTLHLC